MPLNNKSLISEAKKRIDDFKRMQQAGLVPLDGDFFPSVHYPPITMYKPIAEEALFKGYSLPEDSLFDIYAHIPFCIKQCTFCHYPVKLGEMTKEKDYYLEILEKEMDIYMKRLGLHKIKARSILVGGGTPTYLTPAQLKRFLEFFTKRVDLSTCTQFSYDVDPPTLLGPEGKERLKIMRDYGVDRLTIGVQSLNDQILKFMNRPHNSKEAIDAIDASKKEGFTLNIEFIFGYRGETYDNWIEVMNKAVTLQTEEIQLYRLKVVPYGDHNGKIKTEFYEKHNQYPSPEEAITMKQLAILILNENGYDENLRRVFSKERKDYSHYADNQCCKLFDEIGFGLTAFSSLRDRFGLNTQSFQEYYSAINEGRLPVNRGLVRSKEDQARWCLILPLKNREVYKKIYQRQTSLSLDKIFRKKIDTLKEYGLLFEDDSMLKLTQLGAFFADEVSEQFHHPDYVPFSRESYAHGPLYPYDNYNL